MYSPIFISLSLLMATQVYQCKQYFLSKIIKMALCTWVCNIKASKCTSYNGFFFSELIVHILIYYHCSTCVISFELVTC